MIGLYCLNASFGREGDLEGLFLADSEDVKYLIDNKVSVYFGEVLGKHSEVYGSFISDEIELITEDEKVIDIFRKYNISSGYNPFVYNVCTFDMEEEQIPQNGIEWSDCTVQEYIDFMKRNIIPSYYKEEYEKWKNDNNK